VQAQPAKSGQDDRPFQRRVGVDESSGNTVFNYEKLSKEKETEVAALVSLYKEADASEKPVLRQQVLAALNESFEINLNKKEAELRALETEREDVRRGLEFRQMKENKNVENRVREMIDT